MKQMKIGGRVCVVKMKSLMLVCPTFRDGAKGREERECWSPPL